MVKIKTIFKHWQTNIVDFISSIKHTRQDVQDLKQSLTNLQTQLPKLQAFADDLKINVEKMTFKNKPHLERIQEAQARIQTQLDTLKKRK